MANVTSAEAEKVIRIVGILPDLDIDFQIETADLIVIGRLPGIDYPVELLDRITLYLAAHFTSLYIREHEEQELGDSRDKYTRELARGLQSTRFGQTALAMDYKGVLVADNNLKGVAKLDVVC